MRTWIPISLIFITLTVCGCTQVQQQAPAPEAQPQQQVKQPEPTAEPEQTSVEELRARIDHLVRQLRSEDFKEREKAHAEIKKLLWGNQGSVVQERLRQNLKTEEDPEAKVRIERMLSGTIDSQIEVLNDRSLEVRQGAIARLVEIGRPAIPKLVRILGDLHKASPRERKRDTRTRHSICTVLGKIGDVKAVPALLEVICETDSWKDYQKFTGGEYYVCLRAEEALVQIGKPALSKLLKLFDSFKDSPAKERKRSKEPRESICRILGKIGDDSVVPYLLETVCDPHFGYSDAAVRVLAEKGKASVPAFIKALSELNDGPEKALKENRSARHALTEVLGAIGDPRAVPELLRTRRAGHFNRYRVDEAIKRIGLAGIGYLVKDIGENEGEYSTTTAVGFDSVIINSAARILVLELIISRYHPFEDRSRPLEQLKKRYTEQAQSCIAELKRHMKGEDEAKRVGAAICLGWLGDREAQESLLKLAKADGKKLPRMDVVEAIGFTKSEKAVPLLLKLLQNKNLQYATIAAIALGRIGSKAAVEKLLTVLDANDNPKKMGQGDLHNVTAYSLGAIGDPRALPALIKAARQREGGREHWRSMPILALGYFSEKEAFDAIVPALSSSRSRVRWAAVKALGTRGDSKSVDKLIEVLNHEDSGLHHAAAEELGRIGNKRAVPALTPLLTRKEWNSRLRAAVALMQIGDPSAIPALKKALDAPVNKNDNSVRTLIQKAIISLEGK